MPKPPGAVAVGSGLSSRDNDTEPTSSASATASSEGTGTVGAAGSVGTSADGTGGAGGASGTGNAPGTPAGGGVSGTGSPEDAGSPANFEEIADAGVGGAPDGEDDSTSAGGAGGSVDSPGEGGNAGTGGVSGGENSGGAAGAAGAQTGGSGSCYAELSTELTSVNQTRDFQIDFGANFVDFSNTTVTLRLRAEYAGDAGGVQVFVLTTNSGFSHAGWTNLVQLGPWATLTLTPAHFASGSGGTFNLAEVQSFGVQISAGSAPATFGDVTLLVDWITFSDHPELDMQFDDDLPLVVGSGDTPNPSISVRACEGN